MFSKYHGCGNDFIITEYQEGIDYGNLSKRICDRYVGVGADTFIVVKTNEIFEVVFYNADGTIAPMCGNGIRCAAQYLKDNGYAKEEVVDIKTLSGIRSVYYKGDGICINMGSPDYDKNALDLDFECDEMFNYNYEFEGENYNLNAVFMTTHHLVIPVKNFENLNKCAEYFCKNSVFKKMINVDFVKIVDRKNIVVRTFERGVGWTKACGSGTTGSVAVLNRKGLVGDEVIAQFEHGFLKITKINNDFYMTGPAKKIADKIEFYG